MKNNRDCAILLLSGGIDSAACIPWAKSNNIDIIGLTFNFFERPEMEVIKTRELARYYDIDLIEVDVPFIKNLRSLKMDDKFVPIVQNLPDAYVPVKNVIFLGIAAYYAEIYFCTKIILGLIQNDEGRFSDDSEDYFNKLATLINDGIPSEKLNDDGNAVSADDSDNSKNRFKIEILTPFRFLKKTDVIKKSVEYKVPLELTWSCFSLSTNKVPCGECPSCIQRKNAFSELNLQDPLFKYQ